MKIKALSLILVLAVLSAIGIHSLAFSENTEKTLPAFDLLNSGNVHLICDTPAYTQADFDSNFADYAEKNATKELSPAKSGIDRPANVVGVVLNMDNDRPIANATVSARGITAIGTTTVEVQTGSNGRFQIINMPSGMYNWTVTADGYGKGEWVNYTVDCSDGANIFTFRIQVGEETYIDRESFGHGSGLLPPEAFDNDNYGEATPTRAMSSPPTLNAYIKVLQPNGSVTYVGRQAYLAAVLASEVYSKDWYIQKGLTALQVSNFYVAQAFAANTLVEYACSVYSKHGSTADVCTTTCCQVYDTSKTTPEATAAVAGIFENIGGFNYCPILLYKPTSTTYQYICGYFFSSCGNQGTLDHPTEPTIRQKSCTDLASGAGGHRYGLCQMGGAQRAKNGDSYSDIVHYYYTGSNIVSCKLS